MHCLSPKMVCETKIVAEDHDSIPGSKKDTIIVSSSQMWPTLSGTPSAPLSPPKEEPRRDNVYIREFHPSEQEVVRRIFYEGIMERIPNTAFRGLKQQPLTQLLYGLLAVICFVVTKSFLLTCCLPIFLMGMRYYFSRKVILHYLDCALHTDMSDIEQYYMKPPDVQSSSAASICTQGMGYGCWGLAALRPPQCRVPTQLFFHGTVFAASLLFPTCDRSLPEALLLVTSRGLIGHATAANFPSSHF
ncbi:N-acetylaspartate synthetase isoform X2 [Anas platyrhynchos]|uniref:N-acetylaspartate synthetase isoform X2 n=1 Tax=Anas platyrhynchos TaxID=8839 RepID=UPI000F7C4B2D|eukprot:XP_027311462.1 N-acetylaspartate synthetase isoform X2 [Anas platyrhynchos]